MKKLRRVLSLWKGEILTSIPEGETRFEIARRVALRHGVTMADLRSASQEGHLARARQEAWAEMADQNRWSLCQMAAVFDRKDHTTVRCALDTYRRRLAS